MTHSVNLCQSLCGDHSDIYKMPQVFHQLLILSVNPLALLGSAPVLPWAHIRFSLAGFWSQNVIFWCEDNDILMLNASWRWLLGCRCVHPPQYVSRIINTTLFKLVSFSQYWFDTEQSQWPKYCGECNDQIWWIPAYWSQIQYVSHKIQRYSHSKWKEQKDKYEKGISEMKLQHF